MRSFTLLTAIFLLLTLGCTAATSDQDIEVNARSTASVYLLPMQQDTYTYTMQTEKASLHDAPEGEIVAHLYEGDKVVANCTFSPIKGWCQIMEGSMKGRYFWQGCTDRKTDFVANHFCN